nr:hypothetical protein [Actinomadura sp. WAC 06369]
MARSLADREALCDLLSSQASLLERNVSAGRPPDTSARP